MIEKLVELWLDNINERGYQSAFVQTLIADGHTVVHSTRHTPIEFGKDVISIDPDGQVCAYQLKGNPGERLSLNQFRQLREQLIELVEHPVTIGNYQSIGHKSFLVTNGRVDEDVYIALAGFNKSLSDRGYPETSTLQIIQRDELLAKLKRSGSDYWRDSLPVFESIIVFYRENGRGQANLELLSTSLDNLLGLSSPGAKKLSLPEVRRRVVAAAIFQALASRNYFREDNFSAIAAMLATAYMHLLTFAEIHDSRNDPRCIETLNSIRGQFLDILLAAAKELRQRIREHDPQSTLSRADLINRAFLTGSSLADHFLWRVRALKSVSLVSLLSLAALEDDDLRPAFAEEEAELADVMVPDPSRFLLWGEASIPQFLAILWSYRARNPTIHPTLHELNFLRSLVTQALSKDVLLASPYHDASDAVRYYAGRKLNFDPGTVEEEIHRGSSYYAYPLFLNFVRYNLKSYTKNLWPDLTRITHMQFTPSQPEFFCLWRVESGSNLDFLLEPTQDWLSVQKKSASVSTPNIPSAARDDPVMLLAFIIFNPHRGISEVISYLHYRFCGFWFLPFPRPSLSDGE
jgi:hypothetical protein